MPSISLTASYIYMNITFLTYIYITYESNILEQSLHVSGKMRASFHRKVEVAKNKQAGKLLPPASCFRRRCPHCNVWDNLKWTFGEVHCNCTFRYYHWYHQRRGMPRKETPDEGQRKCCMQFSLCDAIPLRTSTCGTELKQGGLAYVPRHSKNVVLGVREMHGSTHIWLCSLHFIWFLNLLALLSITVRWVAIAFNASLLCRNGDFFYPSIHWVTSLKVFTASKIDCSRNVQNLPSMSQGTLLCDTL